MTISSSVDKLQDVIRRHEIQGGNRPVEFIMPPNTTLRETIQKIQQFGPLENLSPRQRVELSQAQNNLLIAIGNSKLLTVMRAIVPSPEETIEEAYADTVVKATTFNGIKGQGLRLFTFDEKTPDEKRYWGWIVRIAKNDLIDRKRKEKAEREKLEHLGHVLGMGHRRGSHVHHMLPPQEDSAERIAEQKRKLLEAFDRLPSNRNKRPATVEKHRRLIELTMEGVDIKIIAQELQLEPSTAKAELSRLRQELVEIMHPGWRRVSDLIDSALPYLVLQGNNPKELTRRQSYIREQIFKAMRRQGKGDTVFSILYINPSDFDRVLKKLPKDDLLLEKPQEEIPEGYIQISHLPANVDHRIRNNRRRGNYGDGRIVTIGQKVYVHESLVAEIRSATRKKQRRALPDSPEGYSYLPDLVKNYELSTQENKKVIAAINKGELPGIKLGKRYYVKEAELAAWLESN